MLRFLLFTAKVSLTPYTGASSVLAASDLRSGKGRRAKTTAFLSTVLGGSRTPFPLSFTVALGGKTSTNLYSPPPLISLYVSKEDLIACTDVDLEKLISRYIFKGLSTCAPTGY